MRRIAILVCCLLMVGCGEANKTGRARPRVALIMKSLANEFFKTMEDGARAHQAAHSADYDLVVNGIRDENDVTGQNSQVEQMIAQKVDAIVLAPADSKALVNVCRKARDAGITVVNIDNMLDAEVLAGKGLQIPFVGPDNRKGAKLAGEYLAKQLKAGEPVAIIEGIPTAFNAQQRKAGFEDAITAAGLKLVDSQSGKWEQETGNRVASAIVTSHPDLKALLCANDNMALGAVAALKAAGKLEQVKVIGFDNIKAVRQLIDEGKVVATVDQHGDQLAIFGIQYALEILKSKGGLADKETPVDLIVRK